MILNPPLFPTGIEEFGILTLKIFSPKFIPNSGFDYNSFINLTKSFLILGNFFFSFLTSFSNLGIVSIL